MKKFALIGNPISHSRSPRLFKEAFPGSGMSYDLVERQTVEESIAFLKEKGYSGANVTSPFKESVMQFVTHPDETTKTLGATNLILFKSNRIYSYNTDYLAVRRMIREYANISQALVIGCGGAAKAAALACKDEGLETLITNRTQKKAKEFAKHIGIKAISIAEAKLLLENSKGILAIYAIPEADGILSDTLKNTPSTGRITIIEANYKDPCLNPESGLKWLKYQAEESFKLFASHE